MSTHTGKLGLTTPPTKGSTYTRRLDIMALWLVDNVNMQQAAGTSNLSKNSRCALPAEKVDQSCMNGKMVNIGHTWQLGDTVPLIKSVIRAENFGMPRHGRHRLKVAETCHYHTLAKNVQCVTP